MSTTDAFNFSKNLIMGLTTEEFLKNLEAGKVGVADENSGSNYISAVITIDKAELVKKGERDHVLVNNEKFSDDTIFLYLTMTVAFEDGTEKMHVEASPLLTKKGDIACYPTSADGKIAGALLYDIVHTAKLYSDAQAKIFAGEWQKKLLDNLKGLKFEMPAKFVQSGDMEFVVLETSYTRKKDADYRASQEAKQASTAVDVDPDKMPWEKDETTNF